MCTGDMTLMPWVWSKNRIGAMPLFETAHTCRNYGALRDWSIERDADDEVRKYQNAQRFRKTGTFRA